MNELKKAWEKYRAQCPTADEYSFYAGALTAMYYMNAQGKETRALVSKLIEVVGQESVKLRNAR